MIRVFKGTEIDFLTNGEVILNPLECIIIKNLDEEYIEVVSPLKYSDYLVQDNIIIINTPTGTKGYRIHNPVASNNITIKAWLCYQEKIVVSADRGAVIRHGKNIEHCTVRENWDNLVTKIIPIGYNKITLPETFLSKESPYHRVYEKHVEFELSEHLQTQVEVIEKEIEDTKNLVLGYTSSRTSIKSKIAAYENSKKLLTEEKNYAVTRLQYLMKATSEAELKEKAVLEAQIPLIDTEMVSMEEYKQQSITAGTENESSLITATSLLEVKESELKQLIESDLRSQAQAYLDKYYLPEINYDLEAHLDGVVEIGDVIHVKHPAMRIDLLTNVISYEFDVMNFVFNKIEFGTIKPTLKSKFQEIGNAIKEVKEETEKVAERVVKYSEEYKRDKEEMYSKYITEVYGWNDGIYGLLEKSTSKFRQTSSLISATVERVNANLSKNIATLDIKADSILARVLTVDGSLNEKYSELKLTSDSIRSTVSNNYTDLDGKITTTRSTITQTATSIRSEVNQTLRGYSTTTQTNSAIEQKADSITQKITTEVNGVRTEMSVVNQTANKINWLVKSGYNASDFTLTDRAISLVSSQIDLNGLVTISNLQTSGKTIINGDNISTGNIDASKVTVKNLSANNIITGTLNGYNVSIINLDAASISTGSLSANRISGGTLDASKITVKNLSADSITSGAISLNYFKINDYLVMSQGSYSNSVNLGGTNYQYVNLVEIGATTFSVNSTYSRLCKGSAYLGFFGASGGQKKSVSTASTSGTLSTALTKLNELINALKGYGLV